MCGIFGMFDRNGGSLSPETVAAMSRTLFHRGPDDQGVFQSQGVVLGNQRLSIIDISEGHQPFVSSDGKIAVVQNGEIYNYRELARELKSDGISCQTHSDTEVLLRLYERDGISFVSKLNGMFSIAIYDGRERVLYLVRDRLGVKPLYLYDNGTRLIFASEIKALLCCGIPRQLNPEALHYYLSFNFVPPPYTLFKDVYHLSPGCLIRLDDKQKESIRWWDPSTIKSEERSEGDWIEELYTTLDDAVRLRLRADVPFGAFLSGGIDSSAVVGLMASHLDQPVRSFSIGFDDPRYDETPFAREAAKRFGTNHVTERVGMNVLNLWPLTTYYCDQPHGDVSFLPTYRVAQLAAKHVKVVLTGDGGDELFAGYDKYATFFSQANVESLEPKEFQQVYYQHMTLFDEAEKKKLYHQSFAHQLQGIDSYSIVQPWFDRVQGMDCINQTLFLDCMLLLPGNNLVKPDRMGMAVSLEARTPFLDYRVVDLAFRMPGRMKLHDGVTKYILKKTVLPLIGHQLTYRKKQMFTVPIGEWFRHSNNSIAQKVLLSEKACHQEYFNRDYVEKMVLAHQTGQANYTREIRALMAFEMWLQTFIEGGLSARL